MKRTNAEKVERLSHTYLSIRDICVIMECGTAKATQMRREFLDNHRGYDRVPTELFVKDYGINEDRILAYAERGL